MTGRSRLLRRCAVLAAWLLATAPAFAQDGVGSRLTVIEHAIDAGDAGSRLSATVALELGEEVLAALHNGVPLTLLWQLQVVDRRVLAPDRQLWATEGRLRLSYRALSRYYSMSEVERDTDKNYPNLAAMLQELRTLALELPPLEPVTSEGEDVASRFRIRLEVGALPPPLRLPAYLSDQWRLDSGWVEKALR